MILDSIADIIKEANFNNISFGEVVLKLDLIERKVSSAESIEKMTSLYRSMKNADDNYDKNLKSNSRLSGGDGEKLKQSIEQGNVLSGPFIGEVMERAIKMGESNACMRRVVAAPTAGSCGVLPAVLITYEITKNVPEEKIIEAMYVAAGIGDVIAARASISGAEGGCQAEIGSASAMAAGAIAYLQGGDAECIAHASALALKSLLGLACDPVAGLVEVPCVKRNVIGAVNAITSADMAIAGIRSKIPVDEVIDAMKSIGQALPLSLKETGEGGLAVTPTGLRIREALRTE